MQVIQDFLNYNRYSRPGINIKKVEALILHWTANPNVSAKNNRDYFNNLNGTYASAHFVIGLQGEIIQCIPENEIAYHAGSTTYTQACKEQLYGAPNYYTIGIELCPINLEGHFNEDTLNSCIELVADLCKRYNLNAIYNVWTHKEVVGWKDCPRWFVNHPDEWEAFKIKIDNYVKGSVVMEQWKIDIVNKALELGLITDKSWLEKANEPAPVWMLLAIANRLKQK